MSADLQHITGRLGGRRFSVVRSTAAARAEHVPGVADALHRVPPPQRRVASRAWRTPSPPRPRPTCASTRTTLSTGCRGARRAGPRPRRGQAAAGLHRLLGLPLVPRHGARVLRGPATPRCMNEHFVCVKVDREERPDVDAIYMEAVQAMTGHGGWPLNVFLHARPGAVLRRDLLPARAAPGHARWPQVLQASPRRGASSARRSASGGERLRERLRRRGALEPVGRADPARRSTRPSRRCAAHSTPSQGGFGGAPEVPAGLGAGVPARARRARDVAADAARDGRRRDQRPDRRRLRPLRGRRAAGPFPHFEKMLYDNALLARAYLHGWLVERRAAAAPVVRGDARLGAARDARPRGRFLLRARRRLRGRRGQVLRVDARRAARRPRRRRRGGDRLVRRHGAGNFEGTNVLESRGAGAAAEHRASIRARLLEVRARARAPRARRQAPARLERARVSRAGRGGRASRARDYLDAARACADFLLGEMRDDDGRLLRTSTDGRRSSTPTSRTTRSCSRRCSTLYEATFEPRWFAAARGSPTR